MLKKKVHKKENGQVLVIWAVSAFAILIFIGLAIDGTTLFLNYTRLKRAVDSAAVAAANDFKRGSTLVRMKQAALEILAMQQVDTSTDIRVFMCDADGNGATDPSLETDVPEFFSKCPKAGQTQKKLIFIRAFEHSPTSFLSLVGINWVPISTTAIAEAAPVDLVIVMDTSESMGRTSTGYNPGDFNPAACNLANNCQPLLSAKEAAKFLINTLYKGYDRVAIVTYDSFAITRFSFNTPDYGDLDGAIAVLDRTSAQAATLNKPYVALHDDPPANKLFESWYYAGYNGRKNPVNPEDRDGNGADLDTGKTSTTCTITNPNGDRWDTVKNIPCDEPDVTNDPQRLDAFDWNQDGLFTSGEPCNLTLPVGDDCISQKWIADHNPLGLSPAPPMSLVSTCTGCGIREATANLVGSGRTNAVWVMVFLSDGVANMSDTPQTSPYNASTNPKGVPTLYPNGYCGGYIDDLQPTTAANPNYWNTNCGDVTGARHCMNADPNTCPPSSTRLAATGSGYSAPFTPPYSVLDYAKDMTDAAALRFSSNNQEARGNDIALYTVGFGDAAVNGAALLRYMAAVGDDGNRETDPCLNISNPRSSCGQYYFAQNASDLQPIFRDIASRIYTKISE